MRNVLLTLFFVLSPLFSFAQDYDLGSTILFPDKTFGTAFYLDNTWQHGLCINIDHRYSIKGIEVHKKERKKLGITDNEYFDEHSLPQPTEEISKKDLIKVYKDIIPNLSDDGEKNMAVITEYCEKQGISMQNYFPEHYWAKSLGEGWFIPGTKELELLAKVIIGGIGRNYSFKNIQERLNRMQTIGNLITVLNNFEDGILSSTMKNHKNGFYAVTRNSYKEKFCTYPLWLELQDEKTDKAVIYAVRKF